MRANRLQLNTGTTEVSGVHYIPETWMDSHVSIRIFKYIGLLKGVAIPDLILHSVNSGSF